MKDIELKIVTELMRNSRRSDRELAKVLHVSQPTVTRVRTRLEKEGIVKEYTMIPDFSRLDFNMISITLATLKEPISEEKIKEVRKQLGKTLQTEPVSAVLAMSGMGCNADRVFIAYHENYSAYIEFLNRIKQHPMVKVEDVKSFLIDLTDKNQYLPLTLSELAEYITHNKLGK